MASNNRSGNTATDQYAPDPKKKFTFGLWTVGNPGRDPFGGPVRPVITPAQICDIVGEAGAFGVNFHDNDLIPIDATPSEARADQEGFPKALEEQRTGRARWPRPTFSATRSSRTARSPATMPAVRAYAIQKTMRAMELGAEFGAKIYVFWGGREGRRERRDQEPGRSDQAIPRGDRLPLRIFDRAGVRVQVCIRGQAQ